MSSLKNLVLVSCVAVAFFGLLQAQANADVIAQWNLNENPITPGTTQAIDPVGGYNMTYEPSGSSTLYSTSDHWGQPNQAVHFNSNTSGNSYAIYTYATNGSLAYAQTTSTVESWFKLDTLPGSSDVCIYSECATGGENLALVIKGNGDDRLQAQVNWTSGWGYSIVTGTTLQTGKWYYAAMETDGNGNALAYLYDPSTATMYTSTIQATTSGAKNTNMKYLKIATKGGSSNNGYFPGTIDDVTVYNTALDQATLLAHAQAAVPEPSTLALLAAGLAGLLCYAWRKRK